MVEPADPQGHLARIHGEDCAAVAVARGATLTLADTITTKDVGGTLVANVELDVAPVAGGPRVEVTQVDRTILFAPAGGAMSWPVDARHVRRRRAHGPAGPAFAGRCDLHAVADDKRGTFFGVHARVDGVEQPVFYLPSSEALRSALFTFIRRRAGCRARADRTATLGCVTDARRCWVALCARRVRAASLQVRPRRHPGGRAVRRPGEGNRAASAFPSLPETLARPGNAPVRMVLLARVNRYRMKRFRTIGHRSQRRDKG